MNLFGREGGIEREEVPPEGLAVRVWDGDRRGLGWGGV